MGRAGIDFVRAPCLRVYLRIHLFVVLANDNFSRPLILSRVGMNSLNYRPNETIEAFLSHPELEWGLPEHTTFFAKV